MKVPYNNYPQLRPNETFRFACQRCGACCRHVANAVMVESLDLFRLARHFNLETAEAAEHFTEPATVDWGAPILLLKTTQPDDACIFLQDGKCSVRDARPRACRLYPLSIGPDEKLKDFLIFNVSNEKHHFKGRLWRAQDWVKANCSHEDRAYVLAEYKALQTCGQIMRRIPRALENDVLRLMLLHRFILFDTAQDFQPQFEQNMLTLQRKLEQRARKDG